MSSQWRVRVVSSTQSTNDDVRAVIECGEQEGLVIQALEQTGGRGRHGRVWNSPTGNLYLSLLLKPDNLPQSLGWYSLIAALAIRDVIATLLPSLVDAISLKWPNDVLINRQKISGVLLEAVDGFLICGIGINVLNKPEQPLYPTACLADFSYTEGVDLVRERLLASFTHWLTVYRANGLMPVRDAWLCSALRGRMTVKLPAGLVEGDFDGLDDNACLVLRLADGSRRAISAGDVFPVGS